MGGGDCQPESMQPGIVVSPQTTALATLKRGNARPLGSCTIRPSLYPRGGPSVVARVKRFRIETLPHRTTFKAWLAPPVILAIVTLALAWRAWTPIAGAQRAFPWDAQWEYWGDVQFQVDAVRSGELPLWNPFDRCGYPYAADPQAGVLYPVNWLLVGLGLLGGSGFWLVTLKTLFHMWWWALGTYVWLRRLRVPPTAAGAAGILCLLAYPANAWFAALNWGMAWAPWVLVAVDVFAERPSARGGAWLALALAMCQLAGAPASFWYTLLIAGPYAGWALLHHRRAAADRTAYRRAAIRAALLGGGLFVVMVAGQIAATAALIPHTVRAARNLDFIADSALKAEDLFGIFVPRMPGLGLYAGMVAVFAAAVALTVRPSGRSYVLAAIAVAGALLAIGSGADFLPSLASFVPLAGLFRKAHRYTYVMSIPIAALGAIGIGTLARLEDAELRRRVARWLVALGGAGVLVFAIAIAVTAAAPRGSAPREAYIYAFFSWIFSAWVLRQLVASEGAWRPRFATLAAVFLVADVWLAHAPTIEAGWWQLPVTTADTEARKLPDVPLGARIFDREYLKFRAGTRLHIRELGGYEGDPLALRRYAGLLDLAYADPTVLGHANVGYVLGVKGPRTMTLGRDFRPVKRDIAAVPRVAPAVGFYREVRLAADEAAALAALKQTAPGTAAVLEAASLTADERDAVARLTGKGDAAAGQLVSLERNHLVAEIDAPEAGVVVVAESYHPGWSALVDGNPARLMPANGAFRGLLVGPGHHRIEMTYHIGFAGVLLLLAPLAMLAAAVLALWRRRTVTP